MPSKALAGLLTGLYEVEALQRANPSPLEGVALRKPQVVRAIGRAGVVLLSGHFERYVYAINEEAVDAVCGSTTPASALPEMLRLQHSRQGIESIASTAWERRTKALVSYTTDESWLWDPNANVGQLDAARLLAWMKSPNPRSLVKAFQIWGIEDIFVAITRKSTLRGQLRLRIDGLVTKRNNIAHGDFSMDATYLDIVQYKAAVRVFCTRVDRKLARQLAQFTGIIPW